VLHEGRGQLRTPFDPGLHQIDSPARRIHFLAPEDIGRARGQAEAAVDAGIDER
jgi:hypothetical protein